MKLSKNFSLDELTKSQTALRMGIDNEPTPQEEFELELLQTLSQYDKWKDDNPGKSYDDFLKEMGLDRIKMNAGGISRKALLDMLKNEYPKEFARLKAGNLSDKDLKRILDNLDKDGVPFNNGGLVSNYKKEARKP